MKIKIALADDHNLVREGFEAFLQHCEDFEVCAHASNGVEALRAINFYKPHILLLDLLMPVMDGFQVLEEIQHKKMNVKILVVSGYANTVNIHRCMELGACGFLSKEIHRDELHKAIRSTAESGFYFNDDTSVSLLKDVMRLKKFVPHFSDDTLHFDDKQMKVLYYHCCQFTAEEIGSRICAGKRTVEGIKRKMVEDLGVENFTGVVIYAHQKGLIDLDTIPLRKKSKAA